MKNVTLVGLLLLLTFSAFTQGRKDVQVQHYPRLIVDQSKTPRGMAQGLFQKYFNMGADDELRPAGQAADELGFTHDRYQQYYKKVKVDGAVYTIHSRGNAIESLSGEFKGIRKLEVTPTLSASQAFQAALDHVKASVYAWEDRVKASYPGYQKPVGELVIIGGAIGDRTEPRLAWKFDIYAAEPLYRAQVYIDASSGAFIQENSLIHTQDVPASGKTIFNGDRNFTADFTGSTYRLRQTTSGGGVETYNLNNGTSYAGATDFTSATAVFTSDSVGNQAHWGAEQTYGYFKNIHNRNSYDNNGSVLRSYVHYSTNYVNAFWDGSRMTYGDGSLSQGYKPLVSLDICGHEITHGVTEYSANLTYSYESGALNESFSDIFGEMVENYAKGSNDWLMSCDIGANGCGAFRSMSNPNAYGDPDTYKGSYWYTGSGDNGGVHYNSGVQNKWFYILVQGESGTNDLGNAYSVTGIGVEKAAKIAYRNLTVYLSASSDYAAARSGAIQAAIDLYGAGSAEVIATTNAWYAVGLGCEYGTVCILPYCTSSGVYQVDEWIAGVKIGNFQKTTSGTPYTYYSTDTVRLAPGSSNSITLTPGFTATLYPEYWRIWIDYNSDRDFDDAGELVYDAGSATSAVRTGTITIPVSASGSTRMRVSMKYNASQTPCETFTYGEVEDYPVLFADPGTDTQAPSAPVVSNPAKTQTTLIISWTAATDNVGVVGYDVYVNGNKYNTSLVTVLRDTLTGLTQATTYAVYVVAKDAAGNTTNSATANFTTLGPVTETLMSSYYFPSNLQSWSPSSTKNAFWVNNSTYAYEGSGSALVQAKNTSLTSPTVNLSGSSMVEFKFYFYALGVEANKKFSVAYSSNGTSFSNVGTFTAAASVSGLNFKSDNGFYLATITINAASFGTNSRFRFTVNGADATDKIYFDQVTVKSWTNTTNPAGTTATLATAAKAIGVSGILPETGTIAAVPEKLIPEIRLYPNPVAQQLQITTSGNIQSVRIFSSEGALVRQQGAGSRLSVLDLSQLKAGMYIVECTINGTAIRRKFIKQ